MSLDDLMKELRDEYVQSLPEKINDLNQQISNKDIDNLINSFHKLKGSGKTYGLPEVSILGEKFETLLKQNKNLTNLNSASFLLNKIYQHRIQNKEYEILNDPDFINLN